MVPGSLAVSIVFLLLSAVEGAVIGGVAGWLVSLLTRVRPRRILGDALLGGCGFPIGLIGCASLPWHQNTISYTLGNDTRVTSTANFYQYPERVAVFVAILLPLLYELNRFRIWRRKASEAAHSKSS